MIRTIKRSDGDEDDELDIFIDEDQGHGQTDLDNWEVMSVQAKPLRTFIGFDA